MNFGKLVFPTTLLCAALFIVTFVVANPARTPPLKAGDVFVFEATIYYGGPPGFVLFTTQEERWLAGEFADRYGRFRPTVRSAPFQYEVGAAPGSLAGFEPYIQAALEGARVNQTVVTEKIPPERALGGWETARDIERRVLTLPLVVTYNRSTSDGLETFNLDGYLKQWAAMGYDLAPGTVFPCEDSPGENRWDCFVVSVDETAGSLTFRRLVRDGERFPLTAVLPPLDNLVYPGIQGNLTAAVDETGQTFTLLFDPVKGDLFILARSVGGFLPAGVYLIEDVGPDRFTAKYSSETDIGYPIQAIGQEIWWEITVHRITRAPPASPSPS